MSRPAVLRPGSVAAPGSACSLSPQPQTHTSLADHPSELLVTAPPLADRRGREPVAVAQGPVRIAQRVLRDRYVRPQLSAQLLAKPLDERDRPVRLLDAQAVGRAPGL